MRTVPWAIAVLALAIGNPAVGQSRSKDSSLDQIVLAELDRVAVPRDTVTKILYQRRTSGGDNTRRLTGIDAWVTLTTCEEGSLIIGMDPRGNVREVYTRRGCEVAGVESTC